MCDKGDDYDAVPSSSMADPSTARNQVCGGVYTSDFLQKSNEDCVQAEYENSRIYTH